ncbi:CapA family protein [Halobacteria archaeon AArc-curdl1]|uniref:CapA family protein n=1 Tax=Natronosalvus hydrolyticus TaxID=2979988 RepID=A0AAP2ZB89_9EURY|nr:CapA family protein [Halobacteria archaeon AArc-curdl1]
MTQFTNKLTIRVVGDLMLGISSHKALATGNTIPNRIHTEPQSIFQDVSPILKNCDLLLGNLECPLSNSYTSTDSELAPFLLGPAAAAHHLNSAEFDCLSLANNHILDHGEQPVKQTIKLLNERGIDHVGDPLRQNDEIEYQIKGRTVALGGFNLCPQGKQDSEYNLFNFIERNQAADLIILMIHWGWGYEHLSYPSSEQVSLGHDLIDAGADIILGAHSHVFQTVEQYSGGIIAYSLGNFLFDMWRLENNNTGILTITHEKSGVIDASVDAAIIQNGLILQSERDMNALIQEAPPKIPTNIELRAKIINAKHRLGILYYYLRYLHKFSIRYHYKNISRWTRKILGSQRHV